MWGGLRGLRIDEKRSELLFEKKASLGFYWRFIDVLLTLFFINPKRADGNLRQEGKKSYLLKARENPDRKIKKNELVATSKELYKNACNLKSLDDPVWTGFSDKDSEKAGDGVVVEGSDWEAFGNEAEMAEPEW